MAALTTIESGIAQAGAFDFQAPDGSRVVLVPSEGPPIVHWAVATLVGPEVDPEASPGMAAACALASMRGTWNIGSLDAQRERQALLQLDAAETTLLRAPRGLDGSPSAELFDRVQQLRRSAAMFSDPNAFRRMMIGAPTQDPRIQLVGNVSLLTFSTVPYGIELCAKLLLERRENQALRGFRDDYRKVREDAAALWDQDDLAPLRAEAMALAYPGSAVARLADRPTSGSISRALAEAAWVQSQHPSRTVHVLTGNFDAQAARADIEAVFLRSNLPRLLPMARATLRSGQAMRRATVAGARYPAAILAWPLSGDEDDATLQTVANWIAGGPQSWLSLELMKSGRKEVRVAVRAPWPRTAQNGMLAIEVSDPASGAAELTDQVLRLCQRIARSEPTSDEMRAAHGRTLRAWGVHTNSPIELAAHFARTLLEQPETKLPLLPPAMPTSKAVQEMLQQILARQPIVVEWRSS